MVQREMNMIFGDSLLNRYDVYRPAYIYIGAPKLWSLHILSNFNMAACWPPCSLFPSARKESVPTSKIDV